MAQKSVSYNEKYTQIKSIQGKWQKWEGNNRNNLNTGLNLTSQFHWHAKIEVKQEWGDAEDAIENHLGFANFAHWNEFGFVVICWWKGVLRNPFRKQCVKTTIVQCVTTVSQ